MTYLARKSERQRGAFALLVMALGVALGAQIPLWRIYERVLPEVGGATSLDPSHARAYLVFVATVMSLQLVICVPLLLLGRSTGEGDAWLRTWWRGSFAAFALILAVEGVALLLLFR